MREEQQPLIMRMIARRAEVFSRSHTRDNTKGVSWSLAEGSRDIRYQHTQNNNIQSDHGTLIVQLDIARAVSLSLNELFNSNYRL